MAAAPSPDCRDDNHRKCPGYGWDLEADQADACPCPCHQERATISTHRHGHQK